MAAPQLAQKDRIDVHCHVVLQQYIKGLEAAGGDPSGWVAPPWSPEDAKAQMKTIGVTKQILSITSPGPSVVGANQKGRDLTRGCNDEQAEICKKHPESFAFFASTPSFVDVEGTIAEIEYSLKTLKALGVVIMTSYGDKLLGHPDFRPIWNKLNELNAIVFIHPASVDIKPKHIAGSLPQPSIDYPIQTTRTAVDLVLTGTFAACPNIRIILSHGGGTLPYLADRVYKSFEVIPQVQQKFKITHEEILRDFQRFYLDVAVSTSKPQLYAMLAFTSPDKILFGSDWPYAPFEFGYKTTEQFDDFCENDPQGTQLEGVNSANAKKLFGW